MNAYWLSRDRLDTLLEALKRRGYRVMGPVMREGLPTLAPLERARDLPWGVEARAAPGRYEVREDAPKARAFDFVLTPQGWKRLLFPPERLLFRVRRTDLGYEVTTPDPEAEPPLALFGVRPCELRAIQIHDRVLSQGPFADEAYTARRRAAFIVVVQCTRSLETCFCASVGTGPEAREGFDLALTEVTDGFVVVSGSFKGADLLQEMDLPKATEAQQREAREAVARAARSQRRRLDPQGLRDLLYENLESPLWQEIGERCIGCGNCTMVCPTCFCTAVEDGSDLSGREAWRIQRWDSCFSVEYAYIHGGSIRRSVASRYRQWLTHKLAGWQDQFGTLGCVGCGRCIVWCPVGIDLTEEVARFREQHAAVAAQEEQP